MSGSDATALKPLETRIARRRLRELKLLEKNARFMRSAQFKRLVENIKRDGALTSVPLVYRDEVLSGNHRVQAAIAAGIEEANVLEVVSELNEAQQVAMQLSHNAIVGEDDPGILAELYQRLDLDWKQYSGLTDADIGQLQEIAVSALSLGTIKYQEIVLLFLPEEHRVFEEQLERLASKLKKGTPVHIARLADFDAIFDAVVTAKQLKGSAQFSAGSASDG